MAIPTGRIHNDCFCSNNKFPLSPKWRSGHCRKWVPWGSNRKSECSNSIFPITIPQCSVPACLYWPNVRFSLTLSHGLKWAVPKMASMKAEPLNEYLQLHSFSRIKIRQWYVRACLYWPNIQFSHFRSSFPTVRNGRWRKWPKIAYTKVESLNEYLHSLTRIVKNWPRYSAEGSE